MSEHNQVTTISKLRIDKVVRLHAKEVTTYEQSCDVVIT